MKGDAFMAIVMSMSHGEHKGMSYIDDSCVVKTKEELAYLFAKDGEESE